MGFNSGLVRRRPACHFASRSCCGSKIFEAADGTHL